MSTSITRDRVRARIAEWLNDGSNEFREEYFTSVGITQAEATAELNDHYDNSNPIEEDNYSYIVIKTVTYPDGVLSEEISPSEYNAHIDVLEGVLNATWNIDIHGAPIAGSAGVETLSGYTPPTGEFFERFKSETLVAMAAASLAEVPIGVILPWHNNMQNVPNLPSGWVECNGEVINDVDSLLHGQNTPNLNQFDGRFLRGGPYSGEYWGSNAHAHDLVEVPVVLENHPTINVASATEESNIPKYFRVAFILKVK